MRRCYILMIIVLTHVMAWGQRIHPTVVISLDGCRWDYPLWYDTPFLDYITAHGAASGLIPSFPSKTFPNHYTIATGLYPDHHGIVANTFLDQETETVFSLGDSIQKHNPKYYGGEPIWVTAQRQHLRTAVFYWPGSDVPIGGHYPERYCDYDAQPRLSNAERLSAILDELSKPDSQRPHLLMAYLDEPDASGHDFGPQSRETRKAVEQVDGMLMDFYLQLLAMPVGNQVNVIILSDHGMAWVEPSHRIDIFDYVRKEWIEGSTGNIPECIYAVEGCTDSIYQALKDVPHVRVWKRTEVPSYLNYGSNNRIGDVVVLPDLGYIVYDKPSATGGGQHGYDPNYSDMHALFRAIGPDIAHVGLPHFSNVNIYELVCRLLHIVPAPNDGSVEVVTPILKP